MIPGKVFFEAIDISEHFTKKYEVYLLMNGIFYDKIKPFQSKYLCLTANDVLEVQLGLKNMQNQRQNDDIFTDLRLLKDKKIAQNVPVITKTIPSEYLKVTIPQAYKLVLQSKTIDIKFHLNSQNNNQEIKIHFSFEPVSSFSRKKLGATLTSNKTALKSNSNFNVTHQRLNLYQRRENNQQTFGQSSFMNSPELYFPERVDYPKGRSSRSRSPTTSNQERRSLERQYDGRSGLSKTMENRRGYFRQKINQQSNAITESVQLKKIDRKFNYMPSDIIIQDESSSSQNYFNSLGKKQEVFPGDKVQYKVDTMKRIIDPIPHFNQGTNIQMLSDIMENNQTYTSRGNLIFQGSQQKITIEKNNQEIPKNSGNEKNYQTQVNLRSFQTASDHDTLESLAYQREKILGQLFGKLGTRGKK